MAHRYFTVGRSTGKVASDGDVTRRRTDNWLVVRIRLALLCLGALIIAALAIACSGSSSSERPSSQQLTASTSVPTPPSAASTPKRYSSPPPVTIDPAKTYTATIKTAKGDIVIRLRPDLAPNHVNSFVFLAREGFYNGVTFHRVIPGFVAQAGDPTGTGSGGPGYVLKSEFSSVPYDRGIVGAARTADPNSAGSQFYITYARATNLDGQYTVFGEVIQGMDVADNLTPRDPSRTPNAPPGDTIITIEIKEQ